MVHHGLRNQKSYDGSQMISSMKSPVIFLDDAGVLNSNRLRGPQWNIHIGQFMADRYGGEAEAWGEANRAIATKIVTPEFRNQTRARLSLRELTFEAFELAYANAWLTGMFEMVRIRFPNHIDQLALHREAHVYACEHVRAEIAGATDAVRHLHSCGCKLHLASNGASYENEAILRCMGIRSEFGEAYGTDIVNVMKEGGRFYEAIFRHACIEPDDAIVVDDKCAMLAYAAEIGAYTVCVGEDKTADFQPDARVSHLSDLTIDSVQMLTNLPRNHKG